MRGEPAQRLPQSQLWIFDNLLEMQYNRHFHDLFTWLKLYPKHLFRNCLHLRLTVWTQTQKIIIRALMCATNQFLSRLVDIESPLTHSNTSRWGITSRNVKIIIADFDSTLNIGTLLVDGQHSTIYFSALFVLVAFVHTYSRRRSRRLPPSPSWHLTLSGLVLNVQFLGALQALFLIDFSSIISFF